MAVGSPVEATERWTYNDDRTEDRHYDFRQTGPNSPYWQTLWSTCCANRVTSQVDPLGTAQTRAYDHFGNVTQTQTLQGTTTFNQTKTTYDDRHRPIRQEVAATIDSTTSPATATKNLTTQWLYCEDLTVTTSGLNSSAGVSVTSAKSGTTYSVKIGPLLAQVNTTLTAAGLPQLSFGSGSVGSATAVINPEDEISVTISDGVRRTVATGIIKPDGTPVTWRMTRYDVFDPAHPEATDNLVETQQIDALGHMTRARVNGVGRTIEQFDAKGMLTSMKYDANGNQVWMREPVANANPTTTPVGVDMAYDARNRLVSQADTQELFENKSRLTGYDANGNVTSTTDAKGQTTTLAYDARDRKVSQTDRLAGVTTWGYDANGNLLSLCDPDNQGINPPRRGRRPNGRTMTATCDSPRPIRIMPRRPLRR